MKLNYVLVGVVALVIGGALGGVAFTHIQPYRYDLNNAEPVDAIVVSSGIIEGTNSEGQATYEPNVTYRYTYDGTNYTSESEFPGGVNPVTDRDRATAIVDRYRAGDEVTAYVNAEDPSRAFLIQRSAPWWFWLGPVLGALIVLYGLYSIVLGIRGVDPTADVR